jgi:hypothetical protein
MRKSKPFDAFAPSPREPGERDRLDVLAWVLFAIGVLGMIFIAFRALLSESDGDFRSWDEIRRQVQQLWNAGFLAGGGPLAVWVIQKGFELRDWLDRPERDRPIHGSENDDWHRDFRD